MFIELTGLRRNEKLIINTDKILCVNPSRIAGCEIIMQGLEEIPLAIIESYDFLRSVLVIRGDQK